MLQIRKILLRGSGVADALVAFERGANVLAGESDTGKSYLVQCLDFILGASTLKYLEEAVPYTQLFVEFENSRKETLTLVRQLSGGGLRAYSTPIQNIAGEGIKIAASRKGKSKEPDVTSVLFPFCNIAEARLRKNARGETQRLTVRTLAPLFLIDEVSIIDQHSPVTGKPSYDDTSRKRALAFVLSGVDDEGVVAAEKNEVVKARLKAKLELVTDLLQPLEGRFAGSGPVEPDTDDTEIDALIGDLSKELGDISVAKEAIQLKSQEATRLSLRAHSQLLGINELLSKYHLLDERYRSDLDRLDFIAEGSFYLNALQDVACPLCDQRMPPHAHSYGHETDAQPIRDSAGAEAAKIQAHRRDLAAAISDLNQRKEQVENEKRGFDSELLSLQEELTRTVTPRLGESMKRLEQLVEQRSQREANRLDRERWTSLLKLRDEIQSSLDDGGEPKQLWEGLPPLALRGFCNEIETVLEEWSWKGAPSVEFDEKMFDIVVDGQPRQSHGKGVRAILYAAFAIGLLRFCTANSRPHPGVVVIDSPLTSYKKKTAAAVSGNDGKIDPGIEIAFWKSLSKTPKDVQIIVIENKEPPAEVAAEVHYEWFAGEHAKADERAALIPTRASQNDRLT
ncbi:hypothetical protein [Burkholderia cenocepacia]|uniref:hypothetical protein n=1 Tax=Burkholderia cenocepacia TaxID=95486 RepID=UPI000F5944C8|nr:hypothetical protein [Burkholderia cenocepacia]RQU97104.1 hypothetical protein DF040_03290 [Burkholderia cenocepacia]